MNASGQVIGEVTSGTVSPSLGVPVKKFWFSLTSKAITGPLLAIARDKELAVQITKLSFVPKRYKR